MYDERPWWPPGERNREILHLREWGNVQQMMTAHVCVLRGDATVYRIYQSRICYSPKFFIQTTTSSPTKFTDYRQIPLLEGRNLQFVKGNIVRMCKHSNNVTFNELQIPTSGKNLILPSKSNKCKFQDSCHHPLLAYYVTYKFIHRVINAGDWGQYSNKRDIY